MTRLSVSLARLSGTLLANFTLYVLAALTGPLAARLLGPDGRGALAAIQLWPGALATIAMLGLPEAIAYFGAREPERAGQWLSTTVALALTSSCLAIPIGFALISIGLRGYDSHIVHSARIYLLLIPLTAVIGLPCQLARGLGRFGLWNAMRVAPAVGWLAVLIVAWLSGVRAPDRMAFLFLSFLVVEAVAIAIVCAANFAPDKWFDRGEATKLLRYALPSGMSSVPQFLNLRLDQMLIAALLPSRQLGLYVVAVSWSAISGILLSAVAPVISQRLAVEKDVTLARQMFARATRAAVIVSILIAVAFAILTWPAIGILYGAAFHDCVSVAVVLVVANAFLMTNSVLEEGLRGLGDTGTIFKAELVGFVVTAISLAIALPPFGIMGAAMASVAGYAVVAITLGISLKRHDLSLERAFRPRVGDFRYVMEVATAGWNHVRRAGAATA